uniref:Uncharacterized protein n=1 Tax=Arundo donax TaxID=35708 RepID=A0A0A9GJK2_ARUDO
MANTFIQMLSEDADVEALSMSMLISDGGNFAAPSNGGKGSMKRAGNYTYQAGRQLESNLSSMATS